MRNKNNLKVKDDVRIFQKAILQKYMEINNRPTLRLISEDTNIQITRVFRILNGCEMRLSEFQKFESSIFRKLFKDEEGRDFFTLSQDFFWRASPHSIGEVVAIMERKIRLRILGREESQP